MANADRPDFINVRLTDHAVAQLGDDAAVGITNAHMHYMFHGRDVIEIQRRGEWPLLRAELFDGKPLFQEADAPAANTSISSEA